MTAPDGIAFPYPSGGSGGKKAVPRGKIGGTSQLAADAVLEVALRMNVVLDRSMNRGELLQRSRTPEPQHGPLTSSERKMRVLGQVVVPAASRAARRMISGLVLK